MECNNPKPEVTQLHKKKVMTPRLLAVANRNLRHGRVGRMIAQINQLILTCVDDGGIVKVRPLNQEFFKHVMNEIVDSAYKAQCIKHPTKQEIKERNKNVQGK